MFSGSRKGDVGHLTGSEINRSCGAEFSSVREMHFDADQLKGGIGGVFYGAGEGVGVGVVRKDQPRTGPALRRKFRSS